MSDQQIFTRLFHRQTKPQGKQEVSLVSLVYGLAKRGLVEGVSARGQITGWMDGVRVMIRSYAEEGDLWIGESDAPFSVRVVCGPGEEQEVASRQRGSVHSVSVVIPLSARVEVRA